jgi:hypothetical protein
MAINRQSRGDVMTIIVIENTGNPVDMNGFITNITLPQIEKNTTESNFVGYKGEVTRSQPYSVPEFSATMQSCSDELLSAFIRHESSEADITVQLTTPFENILDGSNKRDETYTIKGLVTRSPTPNEFNGSDYIEREIMIKVKEYSIQAGSTHTWTIEEGWVIT